MLNCGMSIGLGCSLAEGASGATTDVDAEAWISAQEAAGRTFDDAKRSAVNAFVANGKGPGAWWAKLVRCRVFGSTAAQGAISLKSLTTGSFSGTVTHGTGTATGDGSTGRFDDDANVNALLTVDDATLFWATATNSPVSQAVAGSFSTSASDFYVSIGGSGNFYCEIGGSGGAINSAQATRSGVFLLSRTAINAMALYRLNSGSFATLATSSGTRAGTLPPLPVRHLGVNGTGFSNHPYQGGGIMTGVTAAEAEAFARAFQALLTALA